MIDLHCHILSGVDDGADSLAESLDMAEIAAADGIKTIVATPHTMNGRFCNKPEDTAAATAFFQEKLDEAGINLEVLPGAEVHLVPGLAKQILQGAAGPLNRSRYILLELPHVVLTEACRQEIFALRVQGFVPVLAHPERHPLLCDNLDFLADLVKLGALCQVTAHSITGDFGRAVSTCTEKMIKAGLVHIVASDAHSSNYRAPQLRDAVDRVAQLLGSQEKAEDMVTRVPCAVIENREIRVESRPAERKRGMFARLFTWRDAAPAGASFSATNCSVQCSHDGCTDFH